MGVEKSSPFFYVRIFIYMKLIYSLSKRTLEPHSESVYQTFWVSMKNARDLGYHIELWGTTDAIQKLGDLAHSIKNIDDVDFQLYDDIKVKIWENIKPSEMTIDGDVFLHNDMKLGNLNLNVDSEFTKLCDIGHSVLKSFNEFNPQQIIPEWDSTNTKGLNTGLVNWGMNDTFKKHYIDSYWKLRKWYLDNQYDMVMVNSKLHNMYPAISHIICENLLYQLVKYYGIEYNELSKNPNVRYLHAFGESKYENNQFSSSIRMIIKHIKIRGGTIMGAHSEMVDSGIPPFLYLPN